MSKRNLKIKEVFKKIEMNILALFTLLLQRVELQSTRSPICILLLLTVYASKKSAGRGGAMYVKKEEFPTKEEMCMDIEFIM